MGNKYIAHASIDENGKIAGGNAGDQTGKEVCVRTWYNKNWGYVIRIDNDAVRNRFADNMIDAAKNDCIGYDQNQRNTLLTQAESVEFDFAKIKTNCECDCSSLVTVCVLGAIYTVFGKEAYIQAKEVLVVCGNCATTRTLATRIKLLTMVDVTVYKSSAYTNSTDYAKYGDIYLKEGSHVVAYIESGEKKESNKSDEIENKTEDKNNSVLKWQNAAFLDGFSFPKYGADGEWGSECESIAKKAIVKKRLTGYKYPNLTKIVQRAVGAEEDGKFGNDSRKKTKVYQSANGLAVDGCVGINTWKKILGV